MKPGNAQEIPIGQTFSSDTIFKPFQGNEPVYSIRINGSIQLYSDSSLVRVVLVDAYGNHFLIYESYPLITDTNTFTINSGCDETCFMDGIIPDSLRVDILSAFCTIENLTLEPEVISNAKELQEQAKWTNDSVKIATMNRRIREEHMYWRAGRTPFIHFTFFEREKVFPRKFNLLGFDYYVGGVFEFLNYRAEPNLSGNLVPAFSWRTRHGATDPSSPYYDKDETFHSGWLTPIKDQEGCNTCYTFGPIGAAEAVANLYYNKHDIASSKPHLDPVISELQAYKCYTDYYNNPTPPYPLPNPPGCKNGGNMYNILKYMEVNGIKGGIDPFCKEYSEGNINDPSITCFSACPDFTYNLTIPGFTEINVIPVGAENVIKEKLITKGPLASSVAPGIINTIGHSMTLYGYGVGNPGDLVYSGTGVDDPDITLDEKSPLLNSSIWWFKNSWGGEYPGCYYMLVAGSPLYKFIGTTFYLNGVNLEYPDPDQSPEVVFADEDGDGFYWWGIGEKPNQCPGTQDQEDCDDNNPNLGPYNKSLENGYFLYECLPICEFNVEPEMIRESQSWDEPKHFNRNVVIESGVLLTINSRITFCPQSRLIIKPGATLEINQGGVLTTSDLCEGFWGGIELWGFYSQPQHLTWQGKIIINSGGIIENAWYGIRNFMPEYNPDGGNNPEIEVGNPTGGIIQADGAVFRNNRTAVKFYPYRPANVSYFQCCTFITDDQLQGDQNPDCFIRMDGVSGVDIQGCTFQNSRLKSEGSFGHRGKGIFCINSSLNFPENYDSTYFKSLDYGIYAVNGAMFPKIFISKCTFHNNRKGLYISGFPDAQVEIKRNTFWLNDVSKCPDDSLFMIYLDHTCGFKVWYNKLIVNSTIYEGNPDRETYGIVVNQSGVNSSYIYNNGTIVDQGVVTSYPIHHFKVALQGRNTNRFNDISGLCFKCNDMVNNTFDIVSYSDNPINDNQGIAVYQGKQYVQGGNNDPVVDPSGNTFSPYHSNQAQFGHINNEVNTNPNSIINYIYHYYGPSFRIPTKISSQVFPVIYNSYQSIYSKPYSCPEVLYPESTKEDLWNYLTIAESKIDSLSSLLTELVDGGSTNTLYSGVAVSNPSQSYEVYQDLVNASPYLSDSVILKAIEKEDVLPNTMIKDIMVSNPQSAKNDSILTALDNRVYPMPDSLYSDILQGTEFLGSKELLENELAAWERMRQHSFYGLQRLFISDTANASADDSLTALLENDSELSSKYTLLLSYIQNSKFIQASNILQDIPTIFTLSSKEAVIHQKYLTLLSLVQQLYTDSLGYLYPDSVQLLALNTLADCDSDLPGTYARNLLISLSLMTYEEPYIINPTLKSSGRIRKYTKSEPFTQIRVFPNPCSNYTTIEYNIPGTVEGVLLNIYSSEGKLVLSKPLLNNNDQVIIPLKALKPGIYLAEIQSGTSRIASVKLLVVR